MRIELHLAFRLRDRCAAAWIETYRVRVTRWRPATVVEASDSARVLRTRGRWRRVLLDPRGELLDTDELVERWRQDERAGMVGWQWLVGGADGWPDVASLGPHERLAFGRCTMAHRVAAVVAVEQLYRVVATVVGHPYHHAGEGGG